MNTGRLGYAVVTAVLVFTGPAGAGVRMDVLRGTWRDDFTDLSGLKANQQGSLAAPSGYTINSEIQSASWPSGTSGVVQAFDSPGAFIDATVTVGNPGSTAEYLTLWHARYNPGSELDVPFNCESVKGESCKTQSDYYQNGVSVDFEIKDAPYEGTNWLPVAGWNTKTGSVDYLLPFGIPGYKYLYCRIPKNAADGCPNPPGMSTFLGSPLLGGLRLSTLVPTRGYTATYLAGAAIGTGGHLTHSGTAYLMCQVYDRTTKAAAAAATLYESQFFSANITQAAPASTPGPGALGYKDMTTFSVHMDPASNIKGHVYDLQVFSQVKPREPGTDWGCSHCTMLGPIWLTADEGTYRSPVVDTLSVATRWVDLCWTADMSTTFIDSGVSAIRSGAPLTPIQVSYAVSNASASPIPLTFTITHGGEAIPGVIGMNMIDNACNPIHDASGAPITGRYFQWSAYLMGRVAAGSFDPDLAPYPPNLYFGALRPMLQSITAHYFVCASRAQSSRIAPTSVRKWGTVAYVVEKPSPAATVRIDVLGPDGQVVMGNVTSGASLGDLDPHQYPALFLSASLESDPADCAKRPVLRAWQITWDPLADILELACNGIRPALGEECPIQVRIDRAGPVLVEVHDAAGQSVRRLLDDQVAAEARMLTWNGRNDSGEPVAAGVYFVLARVPGGRQVKKLAVIR